MTASAHPSPPPCQVAVIGGGPAGLRAAEVLAEDGWRVAVFDGKPSVGRKFLVAGRGGLNLTHSEGLAAFISRYLDGGHPGEAGDRWSDLLTEFGPNDLRAWAAGLGVETYVGTSGRVFPRGQQAATLLRRWVGRLRESGVSFLVNHRWERLEQTPDGRWTLHFLAREAGEGAAGREATVEVHAVVFALGGASWPQTGSDGQWTILFREKLGVQVSPWQPANCGWEVAWSPGFLVATEGVPLKNIALTVGDHTVAGEVMVTRYGLEGGALYALGPVLRALPEPRLGIDLKPTMDAGRLAAKLPKTRAALAKDTPRLLNLDDVCVSWRLGPVARGLLEFYGPGRSATRETWLTAVKGLSLPLLGPRPVSEAISCAGGLAWEDLREATLELRRFPGVFAAGEMLDWEAPTGGYLLQGCFATGTRAGRGAAKFLHHRTLG